MTSEKDLLREVSEVKRYLQHLLAIELYKQEIPKSEIGKHLGVAKATVVNLLKGFEKQQK